MNKEPLTNDQLVSLPAGTLRSMARRVDELLSYLVTTAQDQKTPVWFFQGTLRALCQDAFGEEETAQLFEQSDHIYTQEAKRTARIERAKSIIRDCQRATRRQFPVAK